jgi:hypothetical protein
MPSGDAGKNLQTQYEEALRHLLEGWEVLASQPVADEEVRYRFVPSEKIGTIRVHFKPSRPLPPLRYSIDDFEYE